MTREQIEVQVGQVWRDLDKRMGGRTRTITRIANSGGGPRWAYYMNGKTEVQLRIDRLRKPFFELVT